MKNIFQIQSAEQNMIKENQNESLFALSNMQYSLASTFLKEVSSSIFDKEMYLMLRSNDLIDQLKNVKEKDMETTIDSNSFQQNGSLNNNKSNRFERNRKYPSRKVFKTNDFESTNSSIWKEIEEKCTKCTLKEVRRMYLELKAQKKKNYQFQAIQKKYQAKIKEFQTIEKENDILKKKIDQVENQRKIVSYRLEESQQKVRNSFLKSQNKFGQLSSYLSIKETNLSQKYEKIKNIEESIKKSLEDPIFQNSCEKCIILQKIKTSILNYRSFLSQEGKQMDILYQKFKDSLFCSEL